MKSRILFLLVQIFLAVMLTISKQMYWENRNLILALEQVQKSEIAKKIQKEG